MSSEDVERLLEPTEGYSEWSWQQRSAYWKARHDQVIAALASLAGSSTPADAERFRHLKRGTIYTLVGVGRAQGTLTDDDPVVIYRGDKGDLWARHQVEFSDGRFERVAASPSPQEPVRSGYCQAVIDIQEATPSPGAIRDEALEEAAKVSEKYRFWQGANDLADTQTKVWIATAIRALKGQPDAIRAALKLAGNRLNLHAVNAIAAGDPRSMEYSEWADQALKASHDR